MSHATITIDGHTVAITGPDAQAMAERIAAVLAEPCAMRGDFDGYGYKYIDAGSGSDWRTRHPDWERVYADAITHGTGISIGGKRIDPTSIYRVEHVPADDTEGGAL